MTSEVQEHECTKFKTNLEGPYFVGFFSEGQEYRGEHLFWQLECEECQYVLDTVGHSGQCPSEDELRLCGAKWVSDHKAFAQPYGGSAPGWPYRVPEERAEDITEYFYGYGEVPEPWQEAMARPVSAKRVRRKK